jgi:hypothetical protein
MVLHGRLPDRQRWAERSGSQLDRLETWSGMLVYRGETIGLDQPVASIRLKGLRRGSKDYEYFWLLTQAKGGREMADQAVSAVLHGSIDEKTSLGAPGM